MKSYLATTLLASALVFHVGLASADAVDEATEHFKQGVELYRENHLQAALVEFRRANEISPNYRMYYNIGQAEAGLGNYIEAVTAFEQYLTSGGAQVPAERRNEVSEDLARLKARIGAVMVHSNTADATVLIDGTPRGKLPLADKIPLNVGKHTIELQSGERRQTATVDLPGGETKDVTVDFPPEAPVRAIGSAPAVRTEKNYVPMWIGFGVAAASAAGAVTFGILANSKNSDHEDRLASPQSGPYDANGEASSIRRLALVSDILTSVAIVSGAVGVYFAIRPPTRTSSTSVGVGPGSLRLVTTF